jgi:uncharacterized repeat protein (TIGR01451 family)
MKKYILLSIIFLLSYSSIKSQTYRYIPDANFRSYLAGIGCPFDLSGDSLDISSTAVLSCTTINCTGDGISSLEGIQNFINLRTLECSNNWLSTLPTLPDSLRTLICTLNTISSIPMLPAKLHYLNCRRNRLTTLPSLPSTLVYLFCYSNNLNSLPTLPSSLYHLDCDYNSINYLPSLPSNLAYLICSRNNLSYLPALPSSLSQLQCHTNNLSYLPALPSNLYILHCSDNPLLNCLPYLPSSLGTIIYYATSINCVPNFVSGATFNPTFGTYPVCSPFIHYCPSYTAISGNTFNDANTNCRLDSLEAKVPNINLILQNDTTIVQQVSTGLDGFYGFNAIPADTYTVHMDTIESPFYLSCLPSGYDTLLIDTSTLIFTNRNFALQCKPGFDIGTTGLINTGNIRPATTASFDLHAGDMASIYGVHCTSIAGKISINYSGPLHYSGVGAGTLLPDSILPNRLVWNIADFSLLDFNDDIKPNFFVDSSALIGDLVCFSTEVTPNTGDRVPSNNIFSQCFDVRAAYDPNYKEVSPSGTITATQDWLYYTIHFQNLGNSYAENIYIWDTIDPNLNLNTIQVMGASHDQFMNVFNYNRSVRFNFLNIMLQDSATNEPESKGWVQYRIKPKAGLVEGMQINNTASILFDLNAPVVTNTVNTRICNTPSNISQSYTINEGQSVNVGSHSYNINGLFTDILSNINGCDSIINSIIIVNECYESLTQNISINQGESISINGNIYNTSGLTIDTISYTNNCDSIIITNLIVNECYDTLTQNISINQGESISINGNIYNTTGLTIDTISYTNNCDSIIITNLIVNECYDSLTQNISINQGESINVNGNTYTSSGQYMDTIGYSNDCDSIIITNLIVNECYDTLTQNISINQGESINVNGNTYTSSGQYIDTIGYSNDCDSIIITNLSVINGIADIENLRINIYPNPANHQVLIQLEGNFSEPLSIIDMYGRKVYVSENITNKYLINTESWSNGTYIIQFGSKRGKLVVSH